MDAKNTCDSRRNDRSYMDYQGANGFQDAFSIIRVHDPKVKEQKILRILDLCAAMHLGIRAWMQNCMTLMEMQYGAQSTYNSC